MTTESGPPGADPEPWSPSAMTEGQTGHGADRGREDGNGSDWIVRDAAADRDDAVLDESAESQTELLRRRLGAEVIAEDEPGG